MLPVRETLTQQFSGSGDRLFMTELFVPADSRLAGRTLKEARLTQGDIQVLKEVHADLLADDGENILIVDDLTDTGKTAGLVRAMLPKAHFATVYAKPKGRPLVDTFVTEVSQDTWIYFPWDLGFTYQEPIAEGHKG